MSSHNSGAKLWRSADAVLLEKFTEVGFVPDLIECAFVGVSLSNTINEITVLK